MDREAIIQAIDDCAEKTGLKPSSICQYAIQSRNFYDRTKDGCSFRAKTVARLMAWIDEKMKD